MTAIEPSGVERIRVRRVARLREQLLDEGVPLPLDAPQSQVLLEELDYASHPPVHEDRAPRYGSLVSFGARPHWSALSVPTRLESAGTDLDVLRKLADGRASFVVRTADGTEALVCFDRSLEYEASAVRLCSETGAFVVQRTRDGLVRACGPDGVITWDTVQWSFKPLAEHHAAPILRLASQIDPEVLSGLLELSVHWLGAGRVGATLVLSLIDDPRALAHLELASAIEISPLHVTRHEHFPALLSVLGQMDRAALVAPDGSISTLGAGLEWSERASVLIRPTKGTRHTSARRFSFDEPSAVVIVVSEDGPTTVYSDGAAATVVRTDACRVAGAGAAAFTGPGIPDPAGEAEVVCPVCAKRLLVDEVRFDGWAGGPDEQRCPVCDTVVLIDAYRAAIRGVRKVLPEA
ncbi:MAG: hypothetical protein JWL73_956 [Actinomycetia bacterium]|nr:hypothetical protein [Actinomycetes bacterium]